MTPTTDQIAAIEGHAKAAISSILDEWPEHNRQDEHDALVKKIMGALDGLVFVELRHQSTKLCRVAAELHHAEDNGHRLDGDCQGVAPGQKIPAVRIDFIRAAITTRNEV